MITGLCSHRVSLLESWEWSRCSWICCKISRGIGANLCKLLLEHPLFLHHLNNCICWDALINLSKEPSTEDAHVFVHGTDLSADYPDQVVCCIVTCRLLTCILWEMNTALYHELQHELLHLEILFRHDLLLCADCVKVFLVQGIELW